MTLARADAKLGSLVKGKFRGIEVVQRGRSPRIVEADVIGSRGRTRVTGGQLRARFGLFDTWAFFTSITHRRGAAARARGAGGPADRRDRAVRLGRVAARARDRPAHAAACCRCSRAAPRSCSAATARRGSRPARCSVQRGGRYAYDVTVPGVYRVRYHDENGPAVRVS